MRLIPPGTIKDSHGPLPMAERVVETAMYVGGTKNDPSPRRYSHHYYCPDHGVTELPCSHWWEHRGFGTPHKPRAHALPKRRRPKKHHNERGDCP